MTNDIPIITQLRETINRAENMVPFMRQDMLELLEGAKCEIETLAANLKQMQNERDEISIHADVIIKEASALITRCVESRKASAYWNAVEQFRQFESRTT